MPDSRIPDQEFKQFVTDTLTSINSQIHTQGKSITDMNAQVIKIQTVFDSDHPREIARDVEKLNLKVNGNTIKVGAFASILAVVGTALTNYFIKHP